MSIIIATQNQMLKCMSFCPSFLLLSHISVRRKAEKVIEISNWIDLISNVCSLIISQSSFSDLFSVRNILKKYT
jgi:hypothetical protein